MFGMKVQFNRKHVKFVFEGHRVKEEVTGAQKRSLVVIVTRHCEREAGFRIPLVPAVMNFSLFLYLFLLNVYITIIEFI